MMQYLIISSSVFFNSQYTSATQYMKISLFIKNKKLNSIPDDSWDKTGCIVTWGSEVRGGKKNQEEPHMYCFKKFMTSANFMILQVLTHDTHSFWMLWISITIFSYTLVAKSIWLQEKKIHPNGRLEGSFKKSFSPGPCTKSGWNIPEELYDELHLLCTWLHSAYCSFRIWTTHHFTSIGAASNSFH